MVSIENIGKRVAIALIGTSSDYVPDNPTIKATCDVQTAMHDAINYVRPGN